MCFAYFYLTCYIQYVNENFTLKFAKVIVINVLNYPVKLFMKLNQGFDR